MNCAKHIEVAAVGTCKNCESGICPDCLSKSEYTIDNKPLCRNCNHTTCLDLLKEDSSAKVWLIVKLAVNGLFLIIGTSLLISGADFMNALIYFAIGGIPTAWKMTSLSEKDKFKNRVDDAIADAEGVGGGLVNSFLRLIIRVIFTIFIGAIAAPILLIVNIVKLVKCDKRIKENTALLETITA